MLKRRAYDPVTLEHTRRIPRLPLSAAFVVAACSLVFVFAAAGTPIPLYNTYRAEDGITNADLGWVSVGYFLAAATSLLVLGRLSNHLGRRPVAIAALASAALSCLVLVGMHGVLSLAVARVLQGLACGVASSALGSYVVDSAPRRPRWLPAAITGSAPMVGIPIGALACGALVQYGPAPRAVIYEITAAALVTCMVLIGLSPETMSRSRGAMASLLPRFQVSAGSGRLVLAAGAAFVATWSLGGFYQAFGPSVTAEYLRTTNPLVAAAVFSSVMMLNPMGGPLSGRLSPAAAVRAGMIAFVLAVVGIVASLQAGAIVPFIAASLVVGVAQGAASTGGIRALLADVGQQERAGLLSTIYLISYSGAAIPGMIAGKLTNRFDLFQIALGYAALGIVASALAMLAMRNPVHARRASDEAASGIHEPPR
jgi:MFS family permease